MYDDELEKAVLFYVIFEQEELALDEQDFVSERNKKIIRAINELKAEKQEISMLNIKSKIKANSQQVLEYLSKLGEYVTFTSAENVYNRLIELSKKRKIFNLLQTKMQEISESENVDILAEEVIKQLNAIEKVSEEEKSFLERVVDTLNEIENSVINQKDYSLYTGMIDLDNIICGLHKEELTIIGARPGIGKTTFALQIAENIASKGVETAIISLEMSDTQLIQKMIAKKTKINSYKMRQGILEEKELQEIAYCSEEISKLPIHLITNNKTLKKIENTIRKLKNKFNLGLVVIDYLQLIQNKGKFNNREQEIADITRTLKLLSLELKIPIIGLCQLSRNASKTEPALSDLRESGAIEQDADNVIFLYQENESEDSIVNITVKVAKQRAGEIGKVYMKFNKPRSEFVRIMR